MKTRLLRLLAALCVGLAAGLGYAALCRGGVAVPCVFHAVTGLYCPGCGVTRMCLALLTLDFTTAFQANTGLFVTLPVLALLLVRLCVRYVQRGSIRPRGWENALIWTAVAWLLVWGLARNLM